MESSPFAKSHEAALQSFVTVHIESADGSSNKKRKLDANGSHHQDVDGVKNPASTSTPPQMLEVFAILRDECETLVALMDRVKVCAASRSALVTCRILVRRRYISLLIPKDEDGDNSGVETQESTLR